MDLKAGTVLGPTAWRRVTQDDIDTFARLSGDEQWIHTDVARARRESPFGETIAHGNLTLAMIDGFRDELAGAAPEGMRLGVNYGYDRVRFPAPVPAGSELRATLEIVEVSDLPDGWFQVVQRFVVSVRDSTSGKPACVADSVIRVQRA
jgi:acyl dehydratase